ncbi:UNVERIFIED_CONTAM: hypothetical protein FKN15_065328 [Acipenser sinensis]
MHFLLHCPRYKKIRDMYFPKLANQATTFQLLSDFEKLPVLLGEEQQTAELAAQYVAACHSQRDRETARQTLV